MKSPFPRQVYEKNALVYKVMAHPARLEILNIIKHREVSVDVLVRILKRSKANVSQHLAILRHTGLVRVRAEGLRKFYRVVDPRLIEPCRILKDLRGKGKLP